MFNCRLTRIASHAKLCVVSKGAARSNAASVARFVRRPNRIRHGAKIVSDRHRVARSTARHDVQALIEALQGDWGDDTGLSIHVSGSEAKFSDGTGSSTFEEIDGSLVLRGARLTGTVAAPVWQFPNGVECHWARTEPAACGGNSWAYIFLRYKETRLQLRRQLRQAFTDQDFERVSMIKSEWTKDCMPSYFTNQQKSMLSAGRWIVPGVCFRHKKFDYRGVVVGCDPWCFYPAAWRAKWVPNRPAGEAQPFYHCLVDERDRPGRQSRYVAEDNMVKGDMFFPIQAALADLLLDRCEELGGYLPGSKLEAALQRQRASGGSFTM